MKNESLGFQKILDYMRRVLIYMKLYKYKALPYKNDNLNEGELKQVEYCKDIILNNRLFMTPREILNDPLEGMAVPIELGISGSGIYASLGMLHHFVEEKINQYRILSLSGNARSPLMWAHYANNYAGVCFEFELDINLNNIHKVSYIDHQFDTLYEPSDDEFYKAIEKSLVFKSKNWSYEEEYRLITKENKQFLDNIKLTGIIIGHKSVWAKDIINWVKDKNIPIYYTLISTKNYEVNIINKLPAMLDMGVDTLKNIGYFGYLW